MYRLKNITYFCLIIILFLCASFGFTSGVNKNSNSLSPHFFYDTTIISKEDKLFDSLHLGRLGLGHRAYDYAMLGYNVLRARHKIANDKILSIVDFSLPSSKKRLFVIDVKNYKLLFVTYVAHGKNSGLDKALYFSNEPESNKSSVGFYTTLGTYTGAHGYSLKLEGQEIGYNNKAFERDIVVHSADYVDESVVKSQGYLGRSLGCPALSPAIYKQVIQ